MSDSAAKIWVSEHQDKIPALDFFHHRALETLNNRTATVSDLADIITLDPGMSISLYHQVNSGAKNFEPSKPITIHHALNHLGDSAIVDLVTQHKTLSDIYPETEIQQAYHQLMSQNFHLLSQLEYLITIQNVRSVREIRSAAILHNLGEFYTCLFDFEKYRYYQQWFHFLPSEVKSARPVFGFNFNELGRTLVEKIKLPEPVKESLVDNLNISHEARLIRLAGDISHHAETGWSHPAMIAALKVCASYLNLPHRQFAKQARNIAIQSARNFPVNDVLPAAARLILLPDVKKPAQAKKRKRIDTAQPALAMLRDDIMVLVDTPNASQAQILRSLLDNLHDELHFSKVVIILCSAHRDILFTYLSKGLIHDSPFHELQIEIAQSGLFRALLSKPRALWINSENYSYYSPLLPDIFKKICYSENYFLTSIFSGKKSIGLIYCDRSNALNKLNEQAYSEFKSCVSFANKGLTFLSQRDRSKAN